MKQQKYLIYGLWDSSEGELFYIGKSTSGMKRPRQHLEKSGSLKHGKQMETRIKQMLANGNEPEILILETCRNPETLTHRETVLIRSLSVVYSLANAINNKGMNK